MAQRISPEQATNELVEFINDCDGDTLATMYELAFARVLSASYVEEDEDYIEFTTADELLEEARGEAK